MVSGFDFPKNNLVWHIVVIVCLSVSIIISTTLFLVECIHQNKIKTDPNLKQFNTTINNCSLKYYSLLALLFCPFTSITGVLVKAPIICAWPMYCIMCFFWQFSQIFLAFYQVARLKYCFSSKQSSKYGYSNWLFSLLYVWGVAVVMYNGITLFNRKTSIFASRLNGSFGCIYSPQNIGT